MIDMRIDAIVVLAFGAINYFKFMVEVYESAAVAFCVFLASGFVGVWLGLSCGESSEDEPGGR
ncbi:MAG: hypothetical protein NZ837_06240 [Gammaproteobacteria bacterium]|nr:hypothetical protein [Gammaproteobacteria bacterium]